MSLTFPIAFVDEDGNIAAVAYNRSEFNNASDHLHTPGARFTTEPYTGPDLREAREAAAERASEQAGERAMFAALYR